MRFTSIFVHLDEVLLLMLYINGKSAIEWIMERYQITTHKESGIKNNPNDWATEVNSPRYI
jgi:predicted helicase